MTNLFLQLTVAACFIGLIVMLFFENQEFLTYAFLFMLVAAFISAFFLPEARILTTYVEAIEWKVIFFLIPMLIIVRILDPVFEEMALYVIRKQAGKNVRVLFLTICLGVTISASIITTTSTVLIFVPLVIRICRKLDVNPAPFLLGISISINLAATLTPFGSTQNVVIFTHFQRDVLWFFTFVGPYFLITMTLTQFLMQWVLIRPRMIVEWTNACPDETPLQTAVNVEETHIPRITKRQFTLNLFGLGIFFILLLVIRQIYVVALISLIIFVFLNPVTHTNGRKRVDLAHYATEVDYKLIYFFICLYIIIHLMTINGSLEWLSRLMSIVGMRSVFLVALLLLLITSVASGFLENAPITLLFLPIIDQLIAQFNSEPATTVILIAFILGINLGSNFLPQGSGADLLNLELARKFQVADMSFKNLTKYGALFASIHILLGITYLWIVTLLLF